MNSNDPPLESRIPPDAPQEVAKNINTPLYLIFQWGIGISALSLLTVEGCRECNQSSKRLALFTLADKNEDGVLDKKEKAYFLEQGILQDTMTREAFQDALGNYSPSQLQQMIDNFNAQKK